MGDLTGHCCGGSAGGGGESVVLRESGEDVGGGQHLPLAHGEDHGGPAHTEVRQDGQLGELGKGQQTSELLQAEGDGDLLIGSRSKISFMKCEFHLRNIVHLKLAGLHRQLCLDFLLLPFLVQDIDEVLHLEDVTADCHGDLLLAGEEVPVGLLHDPGQDHPLVVTLQ